MTMTDVMMAAAALWLLFVFCGMPGQRSRAADISGERPPASRSAASAGATGIVPYSVSYQDVPQPRYVTPPRLEEDACVDVGGDLAPAVAVARCNQPGPSHASPS